MLHRFDRMVVLFMADLFLSLSLSLALKHIYVYMVDGSKILNILRRLDAIESKLFKAPPIFMNVLISGSLAGIEPSDHSLPYR